MVAVMGEKKGRERGKEGWRLWVREGAGRVTIKGLGGVQYRRDFARGGRRKGSGRCAVCGKEERKWEGRSA